jgi:5-methylcytosine-specific restriction endonuclease McrA
MKRHLILPGFVNGRLTVRRKCGRAYVSKLCPYGIQNYECECTCGKVFETIRPDKTRSCGCLAKESAANVVRTHIRLPLGESARRGVLSTYRNNAKRRKHCWSITEDQFNHLIAQNCAYCGSPPSNVYKHANTHGHLVYSGIDRKNSRVGYTSENCVPCCGICNKSKGVLDHAAFLGHVKKILQFSPT